MVYVISNSSGLDNDLQVTNNVVGNTSLPHTRENVIGPKENGSATGSERGNCARQDGPPFAHSDKGADVVGIANVCD